MLDMMAIQLSRNDIPFVHLRGSLRDRSRSVDEFQTDPTKVVMLMSLRTDNSGLTLVNATHVFLAEPSLSKAVEEQAVNRVYVHHIT